MKEVAEVIQSFFPSTDIETLEAALQSYKDIDAWKTTPAMTEESFNRLQDVMIEAGELNQKVPFNKLINNTFAENATK